MTPPKMNPIWAVMYIAIALLCIAGAAYMHINQRAPLMSPQVLFPSLGAVWFAFRAIFAFLPKPNNP